MIDYPAGERADTGYLALPEIGHGAGVLVLHAWWGLTQTFTDVCDRLAGAGFVAFAPDLYDGAQATTIEEAEALARALDEESTQARVLGALAFLRANPATDGDVVGAIGFSLGAAWSFVASTLAPEEISTVVIFYGSYPIDFSAARASYLGHFAENDPYEPIEDVRQTAVNLRAAGRSVDFYTYPGTTHWFFEPDRPEYDEAASKLAWDRTIDFLHAHLEGRG